MFAALIARIEQRAEAQALARGRELAERFAEALPEGVRAEAEARGVVLSGRRLRRRLALDMRLSRLIAGVTK
ncbi:MAG: hypothetical protein QOH47_154 [Sphingomonadales bacterium]|jgi:phage-related minor tail protein|nr:hypothetical protein [Sphingomonadales bacterium]